MKPESDALKGKPGRVTIQNAFAILGLLGCALAFAALGWASLREVLRWRESNRGIVYGESQIDSLAPSMALGVNASLEQYEDEDDLCGVLDLIQQAGFHWVRQRFPWSEIEPRPDDYYWQPWDRIVELVEAHGLELIAVLDGAPGWARAESDADNPLAPPEDVSTYASFLGVFARRYGEAVDCYQVWDQPNIAPHWGAGDVDPGGYVELLKASWAELKENDDGAVVLGGALAPNLEPGGRNMSDVEFLRRMYRAGAGEYFDVLAAKPYGFWSGPDDRRVDRNVLNYSRLILQREEMVRNGDEGKPVWAVELGWNALAKGWSGSLSPWGTDSEEKQAERTLRALLRAREEWPWLGIACLQHFQPAAAPNDPVWGFCLVDQGREQRLLYRLLLEGQGRTASLFPGRYPGSAATEGEAGGWLVVGDSLVSDSSDAWLEVPFWGSRIDLVVEAEAGTMQIWTDVGAGDENGAPMREVDLSTASEPDLVIVAAKGLSASDHVLRLRVLAPSGGGVTIRRFVVRREADFGSFYVRLALLGLAMGLVVWVGVRLSRRLPWDSWQAKVSGWYSERPEWVQWAIVVVTIVAYCLVPWLPLILLACVAIVGLFCLRGDLALVSIVAAAPFAAYTKPVGSMRFTLVEVLTLCAVLACALRWAQDGPKSLRESVSRDGIRAAIGAELAGWNQLDWAVLFFVLVSVASLNASTNLWVSLRELRTVILEPVAFYLLIRTLRPEVRKSLWLADALVAAGLVLSLHGLYQYAFTDEVIVAEGVRRVGGIYGSPNHLALVLERIVPVGVAMAWMGLSKWRRWYYGAACVPVALCLFLTFSRGAWLLGLPAAMAFLGLLRGKRSLVIVLILVLASLLALLPLVGTERFASTFEFTEGTGFLRLRLWTSALQMIRDHPVTGVGLDNFLYVYEDYIQPGAEIEPDLSHPHNIILDFWTRLGLPGLVALFWLLVPFFKTGLRLRSRIEQGDVSAMVTGFLGSMVTLVAHGLVDNSYFAIELAFVFFLSLGVISRLDRTPECFFGGDGGGVAP